jgi:hypothetical protein
MLRGELPLAYLLPNEWNGFDPDRKKQAKLEEHLRQGLSVYNAVLETGYSARPARRLEWLFLDTGDMLQALPGPNVGRGALGLWRDHFGIGHPPAFATLFP